MAPLGMSFLNSDQAKNAGPSNPVQDAIRILSFSIPRVVGAGGLSPLMGPGSGLDPALIQQWLRLLGSGGIPFPGEPAGPITQPPSGRIPFPGGPTGPVTLPPGGRIPMPGGPRTGPAPSGPQFPMPGGPVPPTGPMGKPGAGPKPTVIPGGGPGGRAPYEPAPEYPVVPPMPLPWENPGSENPQI